MSHGTLIETEVPQDSSIKITTKIINLVMKLCESFNHKISEKKRARLVMQSLQYIAQCPDGVSTQLLLSESDCVQKILSILDRKSSIPDSSHPKDVFSKLYEQLVEMPINQHLRHSFLNFLTLITDDVTTDGQKSHHGAAGDSVFQSCNTALNTPYSEAQMEREMLYTKSNISSKFSMIDKVGGRNCDPKIDVQTRNISNSYQPTQSKYLQVLAQQKEMESTCDIVQNSIYILTGIQGNYLKKDYITGRFKLDPASAKNLNVLESNVLLRLSELGYYYEHVSKLANATTGFSAMGCMGQSFISKLDEELTRFHGQITMLQDHKKICDSLEENSVKQEETQLTLLNLLSWYIEPLHRMQWLTKVAEACQLHKGGQLASKVYEFLDNGDENLNKLARSLLTAICTPLVRMISKWMLEGGISDGYGEFFVESLTDVGPDRLWHDKFLLRLHMLPTFLSRDLADKILMTGKSINFLREICETQDLVKGREELKEIIESNASQIFSYVQDTNWHAAIETAYQQTSKHVLDVMVGPHKLLDHLQGMRRYLLLGQGDFVSILIENMKDELDKKGTDIFAHDLSIMLDAALRCTNAQYDDPEILNHLDVIVQTPYPADNGWDIITLQYTVHGPLATMLEPTMPIYKALFKPLWRMRHMEFVLSMKIWKEQMANAKALRSINSEISKASYGLHLFTSEIMHFVHQMQYYVLFEVIECNWVELQKRVQQATALDDILDAHEKFLNTITIGCFVNTTSEMERNLEIVYDNIICLENLQSNFYDNCFKELMSRRAYAKRVADSELTGRFGITAEQKLERDQERKIFATTVQATCRGLESIAIAYEKAVHSFLFALNSNNDPNLQLFGTRLDFNEYYKRRDITLSKPLTFEHMRMSLINGNSYVVPNTKNVKTNHTNSNRSNVLRSKLASNPVST